MKRLTLATITIATLAGCATEEAAISRWWDSLSAGATSELCAGVDRFGPTATASRVVIELTEAGVEDPPGKSAMARFLGEVC